MQPDSKTSLQNLTGIPRQWIVGGITFTIIFVFIIVGGLRSAAAAHPKRTLQPMTLANLRTVAGRKKLTGSVVFFLALGVGLGLEALEVNSIAAASSIYSDFIEWLVAGLAGGLGIGLAIGLVIPLASGIGVTWLRYAGGIACAATIGQLPVEAAAYLAWCSHEGILRRSDATYQFRHLSLRNHLQGVDGITDVGPHRGPIKASRRATISRPPVAPAVPFANIRMRVVGCSRRDPVWIIGHQRVLLPFPLLRQEASLFRVFRVLGWSGPSTRIWSVSSAS